MTLKFPDLSHYKTGVDVAKYPALITKATEGTTFVDSTFASYKAAAARAKIPFLAYHFLKHGAISAQVAHVVAVVGKTSLMLDVETATDGTVATLADVLSFADQYKAAGGRVVLAYIPHWYWQGKWHSPSLGGLTQRVIGLISSNYTTYSDTGPGWTAYGGVKPIIWQYTSTPMDMNAFKGTEAQLAALFAGSLTEDEDDMDQATFTKYFQAALAADNSVTPKALPAGPRDPSNAGWSVKSALEAIANQSWTAQQVLTGTGFADALAAKLAPSLTGMSEAQIKAAVDESLSDLTLTAS